MGVFRRRFGARTAGLRARFGGRTTDAVSIRMEPGGEELARGLERWAALVPDFREAWGPATKLIHAHNKRTFDSEGAATGPKRRWSRLSPRYAAVKAREFPGRPLLVRTGALRAALTGGGSGSRIRKRRGSLEVGAKGRSARIGRYHQRGTRNMPARPPVQFVRSLRNKHSLPFVVSQMLQRVIVDHRKKALGALEDIFDADAIEKRTGSLDQLARRRTE